MRIKNGEEAIRLRNALHDRLMDLVDSDPLLYTLVSAEQTRASADNREAFNKVAMDLLLQLAARACVRGADKGRYQDEVLEIIRFMRESDLVSPAFSCCLETHCRQRMEGASTIEGVSFNGDDDAWLTETRRVLNIHSDEGGDGVI